MRCSGATRDQPSVYPLPSRDIIRALAITAATVKVIIESSTERVRRLHPVEAIALVDRYPMDWEAKLRPCGQVKSIRCVGVFPDPPALRPAIWHHCYRTTEAPVVQPSVDWLNSRLGGR